MPCACAYAAQSVGYSDLWDHNTTTEFKTATIVTNLWLAAFAVCSAVYGILGEARQQRAATSSSNSSWLGAHN
jgi:hypothetical protein